MNIEMPKLNYPANHLEPVISENTVNLHYGKHLQGYVTTLNKIVVGTPFEGKSLEEIVKYAPEGPIYNNAGQVLNHSLYFAQFDKPNKNNKPTGKIATAIDKQFGSFDAFKTKFTEACTSLFGSGWVWLSQAQDGSLVITKEANGGNPARNGLTPLMGIDVWEHAYYLDYNNRRADHIAAVWEIIRWSEVESRMQP